jgi:hypothetical protein
MARFSFGGKNHDRSLSTVAQVKRGADAQPINVPKATKALAVSLARANRLPMTLVVSAALLAFSKKSDAQRRAECLSLLGVPPGMFRR